MNWLYFPRSKIFAKIRQLCWCDLKHWPDPIIVSWNICKSKAVFLKWLEKFNCLYYHTLNFCKNTLDLMKSLENLHCFYRELTFCFFSGGNVFAKRDFCWCSLKIWPAPIITSKNFRQNKAGFLKQFELHRL